MKIDLVVNEEILEFIPFIVFNCTSLTGVCIFIKNRENDGKNNLGQTIVKLCLRTKNAISMNVEEFVFFVNRHNKINSLFVRMNPSKCFKQIKFFVRT